MALTRSFGLVVVATLCALAIASFATGQGSDDPMVVAQEHIDSQEWQAAVDVLRGVTQSQPDNPRAWLLLGYALHAAGRVDEALPYHLMGAEFDQTAPVCMYNVACVYALKGNSDKALTWLEKSVEAGFSQRQQMQTDPDLESIRSDERFARIMDGLKVQAPRAQARGILPPDRREEQLALARRQFDFWVGEWDVYTPDGKKAGTNSITLAHAGNALIEHWTSAKGSQGTSINYYNPSRRRWTQVWVDDGGNIINKTGRYIDGSMRFEGSHTLPTGERRAFRARFTQNEDGTVRQFIEESTDGGNSWKTWFDGIYVPKGERPPDHDDEHVEQLSQGGIN